MDNTIIEEENFELLKIFHLVSEEAKKEKNAVPPINEILYWWTRKPLIVARAVILASTLKDVQAVKYLLGINDSRRAYENVPNLDYYEKKLGHKPSQIRVFDPFAGAGNLMFEAKRLGLDCYAEDYNPIAYLITKAIVDYSPRYGPKLAEDVLKYGNDIIERTKKEIRNFFVNINDKPIVFLWVWCIRCPYCTQRIPLCNQMWIVKTPKKRLAVRFILTEDFNFRVELIRNGDMKEGNQFTQKGGKALCIRCTNSIDYDHLTSDIAKNRDREMIVVVIQKSKGKDYRLATEQDRQIYSDASNYLKTMWNYYEQGGLIPYEHIRPHHRKENSLWFVGTRTWNQFFNDRQLLVMLTLLKNIIEISKEIADREYAKVIVTFLAFLLCKHVNSNSLGVFWNKAAEKVEHALLARRPSMVYNFSEINPFEKGRGVLNAVLKNIVGAIKFASSNKSLAKVSLGSVLHLDISKKNNFDIILTDPPYMDDVVYPELSDFFYVWLYRSVKELYPELPPINPTEEDISVSWGRFGNLDLAKDFYEKAMKEAFKQISKSLKDDGLLVLFFAHSSTEAWNLLLKVLRESKLRVVSSYAIHTENTSNVMAIGKTSFMSSIIIACRKILEDNTTYFEDLVPKIEDKIKNMLINLTLEELLGLPMTDLLIMTYGKVLEETTQQTILKSYKADFKPEFENLISDTRGFILKEIVTKLTGRSPNMLGGDTSFYIVTKVFYRGALDSNEAIKVSWAYQIKIDDLNLRQVIKKELGITRLTFFDEVHFEKKPDEIDRNNLHQQLLFLQSIADREGVSGVKRIVSQSNNFRIQDLEQIINLLIKSYRMRLNKKEALSGREQKELIILQGLADIFNSSMPGERGTLEEFMG